MTTTTYYKRIETVVVEDRVFGRGIVNSVQHTADWVTLAVAMSGSVEEVRAPKGTLIEAQLPAVPPSDDLVATCARAAYASLGGNKSRYGHDGQIPWERLIPSDRANFERLAMDLLLGKPRPVEDDDERQALALLEGVVVAVARSRGWGFR